MSAARPAEILRQLAAPDTAGPDGELLRRFAASRDHAAFAELVRRHGPLVLTVCRKVAGHPQDAEDAFQAVFLVLARKAAALSQPERLGNWLYGVAVRVSQRARRTAARRRAREVQVTAMPDPPSVLLEPTPDIGPVLHEELNQLPGWYRDAVLLCDLQGVSRSDAAKTLRIAEGTLSSRLATGRKKLAERLARRGITLAAAAVPMVLGEGTAFAAVPDSLFRKTCGLVADWAVGAAVPAPVHTLAAGGFTMRKMLLFGLVAAAIAATGIAVMAQPKESATPIPVPKDIGVADAVPNANLEAAAIEKPEEKPVALGSPRMRKAFDLPVARVDEFAWSPDGKSLVIRDRRTPPEKGPVARATANSLLYFPALTSDPQEYYWKTLPENATLVGFSPDGKFIISALREYGLVSGFHKLQFWTAPAQKPAADERGELNLDHTVDLDGDDSILYAFSKDGKSYRALRFAKKRPGVYENCEIREIDTTTGKLLRTLARVDGEFAMYALADNGSKLALYTADNQMSVYDAGTGEKLWSAVKFENDRMYPVVMNFSQDGQAILVARDITAKPLLLDARTGKEVVSLEMPDPIAVRARPGCFSADMRLLALTGQYYTKKTVTGTKGMGGLPPQTIIESAGPFLTIWDTTTGKVIKSWNGADVRAAAFLPNAPVLAVFENNNAGGMRLGLWDFSAEVPAKK